MRDKNPQLTADLNLSLLGRFECKTAAAETVDIPGTRGKALLALLAVAAGDRLTRAQLAEMLWPDKPQQAGRTNLRKTLSRVRKALSEAAVEPIEDDGKGLRIDPGLVEVDALHFESCLEAATPQSLLQAANQYRGPFLQGFRYCGEAFEDWMSARRQYFHERALFGLRRLSDHYCTVGAVDQAIHITLQLLDLDPLDEATHRMLIRLYLSQDRVGAACMQYRRCREILRKELDIAPSPETESLCAVLLESYPISDIEDQAVSPETDVLPEHARVLETAQINRERSRQELINQASVAVLFSTQDPADPSLAPVTEGIVEEITIALGRIRNLHVLSPTSTFAYHRTGRSDKEVSEELGARYTVTVGTREAEGRLLLSVRLTENPDARLLWGDRFECQREELFQVQRQVVERIITTLLGNIEQAEHLRAQRMLTTTWPAWDLMSRGWQQLRSLDLGSIDLAKELFQQSLEKDPGLGRAYLGLAFAHLREWACNSWNMWFFAPETAQNYARMALDLDEYDGRAHCILGLCEIYSDQQQLAAQRIDRSLELNPNDTDILAHSACALAILGEHRRATECAERALQLSPHRPDWYASLTGFAFMTARRYADGINIMSEAPEAVCDTPSYLAACYAHLGKLSESRRYADTLKRHYQRHLARGEHFGAKNCLDWVLSMAPYRLQTDREHFHEGLRLAGL